MNSAITGPVHVEIPKTLLQNNARLPANRPANPMSSIITPIVFVIRFPTLLAASELPISLIVPEALSIDS